MRTLERVNDGGGQGGRPAPRSAPRSYLSMNLLAIDKEKHEEEASERSRASADSSDLPRSRAAARGARGVHERSKKGLSRR